MVMMIMIMQPRKNTLKHLKRDDDLFFGLRNSFINWSGDRENDAHYDT